MRKDGAGIRQQISLNAGADEFAIREHLAASLKASGWRVAKSLDQLLSQVNTMAPNRDKSSDGSIGDGNHENTNSDHNPWVTDSSGRHVVTARDITHDPDNGCDCTGITAALAASKDRRIKYIIWNSRIISSQVSPWRWRAYHGSNPHDQHFHISVLSHQPDYDATNTWRIE